ncbi:Rha family transcriptional regulator [Ottowia testudinis]|uniref:Rha family transcriptional regulator n=1 Tax=Ottowia testudinis TaxID=2816950 RepID=A0A975CDF2_9BURK|nr:Rha family transcriptional regulator [Ottowia testudinis]QTD44215.1 Rha family transcriptional regulator [Ottowia testudinis]
MNTPPISTTTSAGSDMIELRHIGTTKEPRVDSRLIAGWLDIQHRTAMKTIQTHRAAFADLGKVRFQIAASTDSRTGQQVRFALLNEDQAHLLLTMSRNTPRVVALKVALVKAFRESRVALEAYRTGTLPTTKALQDAIQAVPGGPGPWLHSNVSKLVNKAAGIAAGTRGEASAVGQAMLMMLQATATRAMQEATDAKHAYALAADALELFSGVSR